MEFAILDSLQKIHTPMLDTIMTSVTKLGNSGIIWILTGIVLLCIPKYRKGGVLVMLALILNLILGNLILKNLIVRERPCWIKDGIELLIAVPRDYSFPSGHTMSGFAAATAIWFTEKRLGIAAFLLAALIGFSRLYLYVHFPTDVLAGAVLGILVGIAAKGLLGMKKIKQNTK